MPEWIERFLAADPRDSGCDEVIAVLHVYVDLRAAGIDPEVRYPGIESHLNSCSACAETVRGLIAAVSDADLQDGMAAYTNTPITNPRSVDT